MSLIFSKLRRARELLKLTQEDAAKYAGISQRDISQLENGKKEFIPTGYIQFLNSRGISLSSLFGEATDVYAKSPNNTIDQSSVSPGPCQQCELRERLLHSQEDQIRLLNERLSELQACHHSKSKAMSA